MLPFQILLIHVYYLSVNRQTIGISEEAHILFGLLCIKLFAIVINVFSTTHIFFKPLAMKSPSILTSCIKLNNKRAKCSVCRKKLKAFEGKLCSCSAYLCIKHRYKEDHFCKEGLIHRSMEKIIPKKVDVI